MGMDVDATATRVRGSARRGMVQGAKAGTKWFGLIGSVPAVLVAMLAVGAWFFGIGAGLGYGIPAVLLKVPRNLAMLMTLGGFLGGLVGGAAGLIGKMMPGRVRERIARGTSPIADEAEADPIAAARTVRPRWPLLARVLIGGLVPIAVAAPVGAALGYAARKHVDAKIERAVAVADADDPGWRLDDILDAREPVPDEEDGALISDEVASMVPEKWPPDPKVSGLDPEEAEFGRAYALIGEIEPNVRFDDRTAEVLRRERDALIEPVKLARTLAGKRTGFHTLEIGRAVIDTPLPQTQAARVPTRLLYLDLAVRAHDRDFDGAIESCRAILGAARSIGDEHIMITGLVRGAIQRQAALGLRRILGQGEPGEAALATLQRELTEVYEEPEFLRTMRWERAMQVETLRRVADLEISIADLSGTSTPVVPVAASWAVLWYRYQMAVGLEWANADVERAKQPDWKRAALWMQDQEEFLRLRKSRIQVYLTVLPMLMRPAVAAADGTYSRGRAEVGAAILLLAAERQRRETKAWPERPEAIDKRFLPAMPLDPFTGSAYLTKREGDALTFYTVGENLKDQVGVYRPTTPPKRDQPDDIGTTGWLPASRGVAAKPDAKGAGRPPG